MDSQHRHELEENELAHWLEREINKTKPYLPVILLGLIGVVGGSLGWSAWKDAQVTAEAEAWRGFTLAVEGVRPNLEALQVAIDKNPGTAVEQWSRITWADGRLWNAAQEYLRNKAKAQTALTEAEATYQELLGDTDPEIVDRARFGMARLHEMQGDLDKAREQYQSVGGTFAQIATERAEALTSERLQADYAWITQTPDSPESDAPAVEEEADATSTLDAILSETLGTSTEETSKEEPSSEETEQSEPVRSGSDDASAPADKE